MRDDSENGQLDAGAIPKFPAGFGFDVVKPAVHERGHPRQYIKNVTLEDVAEADQKLGWARQFGSKPTVDFAEHRDDFHQQEDSDTDGKSDADSETDTDTDTDEE